MSEHQPLLQLGTPLRDGDPGYVILRLDSGLDVEMALSIINDVTEKLAPLTVGLADTVSRLLQGGDAHVVGQLQQAGLNPVPMAAPQPAAQPFQPQPQPIQAGPAQPVYQPQAQASQAYAQPVQQAQPMSSLLTGPCWAASPRKAHTCECKDCGQPTYLTVKTIRGGSKTVNAHVCSANPQHKVTWCEDQIWNSKVVEANGRGIGTDPRLVTG